MKRVLVAVGTLVAAVAIVVACGPGDLSDLTRGEQSTETPPAPADDSGLPPIPTCKGERPPPKDPSASNAGNLGEVLFAVDNLRVDADTSTTDAGIDVPSSFNLDNNCACKTATELSCLVPDGGRVEDRCDDATGRDNTTGGLLAKLITILPTFQPRILKERIAAGAFSILVSLGGWNGKPDDPEVVVGVRLSTGNGNPINPETQRREPLLFDGTDTMCVDPASVADPAPPADVVCTTETCIPKALDFTGYVTGGKVVASFSNLDMAFDAPSGRVVIPFKGASLVATISGAGVPGNPWRLNGQIAGRWTTTALLNVASAFNVGATNPLLDICKNQQAYDTFKTSICTSADLAADPANDNKRGVKCDALSEAMGFTAVTAKLGIIRAPIAAEGTCRPPDTCP